ncbi:MAG: sigma 54-interacting transcriptional regulator [Proteobacteria bacterium]|nr:sigma 54-interacting transcriptional regulator [Pseudomonadota bacterium]
MNTRGYCFGAALRRKFFNRYLLILGTAAFSAGALKAAEGPTCGSLLVGEDEGVSHDVSALTEEHSLLDIINNPQFFVDHPTTVMNAHQKLLSWIYSQPFYDLPDYPGNQAMEIFPALSHPLAANHGRMIVGNYEEIQSFVDFLRAGASGSGSTSKMLLYVGPAGTGKSEFINVLSRVGAWATTQSPEFFEYTFEWTGLDQIDALKYIGRKTLTTPLQESPFVLLPDSMQEKVLALATSKVQGLIGFDPKPIIKKPNPQSQFVRESILAQYSRQRGKKQLSNKEVVEILSKHVKIKRRILTQENFPKIDAQGRDVPYHELFVDENPLISKIQGPTDPFAHFFNGQVLKANGNMLFLDELFRNEEPLIDHFLGVIENHNVQRGASPTIPFDAVIIAASNNESVEKMAKKGAMKAILDRSAKHVFNYSVDPREIGKTALLMANVKRLEARKLPTSSEIEALKKDPSLYKDQPYSDVTVHELMPIDERSGEVKELDGRYSVRLKGLGKGNPIHMNPYTLLFMSSVVAASRMETDVRKAMATLRDDERGEVGVLYDRVFHKPTVRLKYILGEYTDVTPTQQYVLKKLTRIIEEGRNGHSQRDLGYTWIEKCFSRTNNARSEFSLSPLTAMEVFEDLLLDREINFTEEQRIRWRNLASAVMQDIIIPRMMNDIMEALSFNEKSIETTYEEIMQELLALRDDAKAEYYYLGGSSRKKIERTRLDEIKEIYQKEFGRPLNEAELVNLAAAYGVTQRRNSDRLMKVIRIYSARNVFKSIPPDKIFEASQGVTRDSQALGIIGDISTYLIRYRGYDKKGVRDSFEVWKNFEDKFNLKTTEN